VLIKDRRLGVLDIATDVHEDNPIVRRLRFWKMSSEALASRTINQAAAMIRRRAASNV